MRQPSTKEVQYECFYRGLREKTVRVGTWRTLFIPVATKLRVYQRFALMFRLLPPSPPSCFGLTGGSEIGIPEDQNPGADSQAFDGIALWSTAAQAKQQCMLHCRHLLYTIRSICFVHVQRVLMRQPTATAHRYHANVVVIHSSVDYPCLSPPRCRPGLPEAVQGHRAGRCRHAVAGQQGQVHMVSRPAQRL